MLHILFIALFLITMLIFVEFPGIDIAFSHLFYDDTSKKFFLAHNPIVLAVHKGVPIMCTMIVMIVGVLGIKTLIKYRSIHPRYYRELIYVTLVCLLGAGFIIHSVFKDNFNRARPKEIIEFGGTATFTPAFVISNQCHHNCSFVSGHAAAGFMLYSIAFLFKGRKKFYIALLVTFFGITIGLVRIIQGGHFLSDVIFAGYIMYAVAYVLAHLMKIIPLSDKIKLGITHT